MKMRKITSLKSLIGLTLFAIMYLSLSHVASAVTCIPTVTLIDFSYTPGLEFPYHYHYSVSHPSCIQYDISHWSLYVPCMHSGSTLESSISDPTGFSHESPQFEGSYGIKWEGLVHPGETISCFGFDSKLPKGWADYEVKVGGPGGGTLYPGMVEGPERCDYDHVPEPASLTLLGIGLLGLTGIKRRKKYSRS